MFVLTERTDKAIPIFWFSSPEELLIEDIWVIERQHLSENSFETAGH